MRTRRIARAVVAVLAVGAVGTMPSTAAAGTRIISGYDVLEDVATTEGQLWTIGRKGYPWEAPNTALMTSRGGRAWDRIGVGGNRLHQSGGVLFTTRADRMVSLRGRRVRSLTGLPGVAGADYFSMNDVLRNGGRFWAVAGVDSDAVLWGQRVRGGSPWWEMRKVLPTEYDGHAEFLIPQGKGVLTLVSEFAGDGQWMSAFVVRADGTRRRAKAPPTDFITDVVTGDNKTFAVGGRHTWPVGSTAAYLVRRTDSGWRRHTIRAVRESTIDTGSRLPYASGLTRTRKGLIVSGSVSVQRCGPYAPEDCGTKKTIPVLWRQKSSGGWSVQQLGTAGFGSGQVEAVTVDDGRLVAVGAVWRGDSLNRRAAVWRLAL